MIDNNMPEGNSSPEISPTQELPGQKSLAQRIRQSTLETLKRLLNPKIPNIQTPIAPEETNNTTEETIAEKSEILFPPVPVYVGLEEFEELSAKEHLHKGAANIGLEHSVETISQIEKRRQELCKKYDIDTDDPDLNIMHGKSMARILIQRAADAIPPVQPGYIRMFRGEGPHPGKTEDQHTGRWFAHDLTVASSYPIGELKDSRILYVDIPKTTLRQHHVDQMEEFKGSSKIGEYLLTEEIIKTQAKELVRFLQTSTTTDPWIKSNFMT